MANAAASGSIGQSCARRAITRSASASVSASDSIGRACHVARERRSRISAANVENGALGFVKILTSWI